MADRHTLSVTFLQQAGWGDAERAFLAGDASGRTYDRVRLGPASAVLMDAPPGKSDDPAAFLAIAAHLSSLELSAPHCLAQDLPNGFLLLEDFGDGLFARLAEVDNSTELHLYHWATKVLARLQAHTPPAGLPNLSAEEWAEAACLALSWYGFAITGDRADPSAFRACLADALRRHADGPRVLILRDYHAENLLWLPDREGISRVGILDFQLAQLGQPGYDLVSLLQDARRDVSPETEAAMMRQFAALTGQTEVGFRAAYAALGAQRALRILGVFARLCLCGDKSEYVRLIPRVWSQLWRNLAEPELADLAAICRAMLPPPTHSNLQHIGAQCGHFR